ncbi:MAG: phage portal protein [Bacillota bacterium]|nr:phage portal protein [Bacillota bacterium]
MKTTETALIYLKQTNGQVTSKILKDLINEHSHKRGKMMKLYERYKASKDGVPIFSREFEDENKVNNKLNNDFFSEVIDTKIGYFAGKAIAYQLDNTIYKSPEGELNKDRYNKDLNHISDFNIRNNVEDLDAETAKLAAICGYGARLLYIDKEGKERVMDIPPWEAIFVSDRSIDEPQYALRYYIITVNEKERIRVEWYDNQYVTFYIQDDKGEYVLDDTEPAKEHLFSDVPLIAFINNKEMQGDCEKVLSLVDSYDKTLSDVNSELEQFRLAYMAFYGVEPDEEVIVRAKKTGAFGLGSKEDTGIEFITKDLNDTIIENHLNRLEDNILRFAKSVNFSDESFAGNLSGVALKYKLFNLESKCITAERKMTAALRRQYKLLTEVWKKKGIEIDYTYIYFAFKRNFPLNLLDEAQTTGGFKGLISEKTRLGLLSFVDDVDFELEQMRQEQEENIDLDIIEDDEDGTGSQGGDDA